MEDQRLCLDRISNLPPSIIETILCRLPTRESVRTSILSTGWKYHWTKLPKFDFIEKFEARLRGETPQARRKLFSVINQLMSKHECPIEEFSLDTYVHGACVELDHIIDNFSRNNNLKKLKLVSRWYWIPESFFSFHKLTDLRLQLCHLEYVPPTFSGFGSLTNLSMNGVRITKRMLQLFLSRCPLLKTVTLIPYFGSLPDNDDSTLAQLFKCLPKIESLTVPFSITEFYYQGRVPNQLPAIALVHLKHLRILDACYQYRLQCYVYLVRSCLNMEKLTLKVSHKLYEPGEDFINGDSYSDIWLGHLNEVEIYFPTRMTYFHPIMLILAKSPLLKKVTILLSHEPSKDQKLSIERRFSRTPRVSRAVKFIVTSGKLRKI